MLKLTTTYPRKEEELEILNRMTAGEPVEVEQVVTLEEIVRARSIINQVYMDEKIKQYIVDLVFATRSPKDYGELERHRRPGWSTAPRPRATIYLATAARAHAFLRRRGYVTPEDVKSVGMDVMRHRVIVTYEAEAEDMTSEQILQRVFDCVEIP